jgi:hypothetical protein
VFGIFKKMQPAAPPAVQPASAVESAQSPHYLDIWRRLSTDSPGADDELLRARLAETVAWCDSLMSLENLRSKTLSPRLFHDGPDDLVRDLGQSRQHQLRYRKLLIRYQSPVVATGRFMLYFPDENLADGYAEVVSGGFFDGDNLPAYDTWVSFFSEADYPRQSARRYLLCYVPEPLIESADAGIEGNPEECIVWLDQSDSSIRRRVEALTSRAPRRTNTA